MRVFELTSVLMSTKSRLILSIVAIALAVYSVVLQPTKLGLDLRGGTQVVLDLSPRPGQPITSDLAERTRQVIERRVDSLGVADANVSIENNTRILVELPGVSDPTQAVQTIGSTAQLTVHPVTGILNSSASSPTTGSSNTGSTTTVAPPSGTTATTAAGATPTTAASLGAPGSNGRSAVLGDVPAATSTPATTAAPSAATSTTTASTSSSTTPGATTTTTVEDQTKAITAADDNGTVYQLGPSVIDGNGISTADANPPDQNNASWYLTITFKGAGAKEWTKLTGQEACNPNATDGTNQSAFVLDGKIIEVSGPASSVQCNVGITGNVTEVTGSFTEKQVKNLALLIRGGALPVNVKVSEQQTVGPELGKAAIHDSVKAVIIGGAITIIYIIAYYRLLGVLAALALGTYGLLSFALLKALHVTLTLPGIAAFVLAIAMAMDSNVLVYERVKEEFANGRSVRQGSQMGFKNALSAIIDSNATTFIAAATLFARAIGEVKGFGITLMVGTGVSIFTTLVILRMLVIGLLSSEFARNRPRLLGMHVGAKFRQRMSENPPDLLKAARYFCVLSVIIVILGATGIAVKGINYGIEFAGGRVLEYKTTSLVDLDKARSQISGIGLPAAIVQRADQSNTSVRVKSVTDDQLTKIDNIMKTLGGGKETRVQDTKIGPSFSKELKRDAFIALLIGVALQLAWVAYRFRWTFGIGAVVAMIHDSILVLGVFAWLGKQFDSVFLAALLTIIAYSVNDTVVVFDRIREQRRRRASESFARVVSDACAQTFPRTLNIGLSAIFILGALFLLGGSTLSDFSLALLIGVVTGVYSSVMVASPVAILLERLKPSMSSGRAMPAQRRKPSTTTAKATDQTDSDTTASPSAGTNRPAPRPRKKSSKKRR
jgi:SecD/SecF fusion protein